MWVIARLRLGGSHLGDNHRVLSRSVFPSSSYGSLQLHGDSARRLLPDFALEYGAVDGGFVPEAIARVVRVFGQQPFEVRQGVGVLLVGFEEAGQSVAGLAPVAVEIDRPLPGAAGVDAAVEFFAGYGRSDPLSDGGIRAIPRGGALGPTQIV